MFVEVREHASDGKRVCRRHAIDRAQLCTHEDRPSTHCPLPSLTDWLTPALSGRGERMRASGPLQRRGRRFMEIPQTSPTRTQASRWRRVRCSHSWSLKPHLLGSLPDKLECRAGGRPWIRELKLVRRERGDNAFLIGPEEVRVRTCLNVCGQHLIRLVE